MITLASISRRTRGDARLPAGSGLRLGRSRYIRSFFRPDLRRLITTQTIYLLWIVVRSTSFAPSTFILSSSLMPSFCASYFFLCEYPSFFTSFLD